MMKMTRFIPSGFTEFKPELGEYPENMFACYVNLEKLSAIFYTGKQSNHTWYNRFMTVESMKKKITETISRLMSWEEKKAERKEARKAAHSLEIGNILSSSWGYEQTNINFYQVTRVLSSRSVEIREISSKILRSSNYGTQEVIAVPNGFLSEKRGLPKIKRVSPGNVIKLSSYEWAYPWNGESKQETALGYGH